MQLALTSALLNSVSACRTSILKMTTASSACNRRVGESAQETKSSSDMICGCIASLARVDGRFCSLSIHKSKLRDFDFRDHIGSAKWTIKSIPRRSRFSAATDSSTCKSHIRP